MVRADHDGLGDAIVVVQTAAALVFTVAGLLERSRTRHALEHVAAPEQAS